ncbi:hypothetical protein OF117_17425 [Geodermatophilus sp. YIM 151500]|uniref:hypothetical protein n=1 Tax=Geodermatophilus sp. YIM 151500 TaxID=2984531 RepID=UPI0021E3C81E|nr:hypothetical protein [Geodermatophilus sp. YIM 151500]MCV2491133.1 hypothetical protein [Geodermatophilus sp. YIM 151500]
MFLSAVVAQALTSALLLPVLTRALQPAAYGSVALVAVSQQLITAVLALGLPGLVTSWEAGGATRALRTGAALPVLAVGAAATAAAAAAGSVPWTSAVLLGSLNAVASLVLARAAARGSAAVWAGLTVAIGPVAMICAALAALVTGSLLAYLTAWTTGVLLAVLVGLRWADREWFRPGDLEALIGRTRLSMPLAVSAAAGVALAAGDRIVVGLSLGEASLARYAAAYAIGNLAVLAAGAVTTQRLHDLMRDDPAARRDHLLAVSAVALLGALASWPALLVLLPPSYRPAELWPVAAVAALSAIPQALYLRVQARATHLGCTSAVGAAAFTGTALAMAATVLAALVTRSFVLIAAVTPVTYALLATVVQRRTAVQDPGTARPVVVLLSTVRWNFLWQRHHSLSVAAAGVADVVFVESQPRRVGQLLTYPLRALRRGRSATPGTPPLPGIRLVGPSPATVLAPRRWARRLAEQIARQSRGARIDVILYAPSAAYLHLASELADRGASVTYDAVIDWALAPHGYFPPRRALEAEAALPPDWRVVSDSPVVAGVLERRTRRPVPVVLPAADDAFLQHLWTPLADREPVVGWFGALHPEVDVHLLCAARRAGLRVEAIGPVLDQEIANRLVTAGVTLLPPEPIELLPARIANWRVALLAYTGPRAATITPAKLVNALVGFRVATRGITVPASLTDAVVRLPADDAAAVTTLLELVETPGCRAVLAPEQLSWRARLSDVTGMPR